MGAIVLVEVISFAFGKTLDNNVPETSVTVINATYTKVKIAYNGN